MIVPGGQLPTRQELQRRFGASNTTVQRALDRLLADGFIETRGRGGSVVVAHPPHLTRFGLVFGGSPADAKRWNPFSAALVQRAGEIEAAGEAAGSAAQTLIGGEGLRFPAFYDVRDGGLTPGGRELAGDVQRGRIAGLIFVSNPDVMADLLPSLAGVPAVTLVRDTYRSQVPRVHLDRHAFVARALDWLRGRGRRRVAFLSPGQMAEALHDHVVAELAARGMPFRPYWMQEAVQTSDRGIRNAVHLLMHAGQHERPDALVVTDDNLVPSACDGLLAAGVSAGEADVVAHCNFPLTPPHAVPVRLLGYDVREVLDTCLRLLREQARGVASPPMTRILPRFEEEVQSSDAPRRPGAAARTAPPNG